MKIDSLIRDQTINSSSKIGYIIHGLIPALFAKWETRLVNFLYPFGSNI